MDEKRILEEKLQKMQTEGLNLRKTLKKRTTNAQTSTNSTNKKPIIQVFQQQLFEHIRSKQDNFVSLGTSQVISEGPEPVPGQKIVGKDPKKIKRIKDVSLVQEENKHDIPEG